MISTDYSSKYNMKRIQKETGIPYYVKPNFDTSSKNVFNVERDLLGNYYQFYQQQCINEINKERFVILDDWK